MTRKDYRVIAECLKKSFESKDCNRDTVYLMTEVLNGTYHNFNGNKFLEHVFQHKPARC